MSAVAREAFAQLLQEIDAQEQLEQQRSTSSSGPHSTAATATAAAAADPASLASLAWGLHRAGHCQPVLLDALALLLPETSLAALQPAEALRLLEACRAACQAAAAAAAPPLGARGGFDGGEVSGARQILEGLAPAIAASARQYDAWQAARAATHYAAAQHLDEGLMR